MKNALVPEKELVSVHVHVGQKPLAWLDFTPGTLTL